MKVHILHHGQPFCGFSTDLPANWPSGHFWVSVEHGDKATCSDCKAQVEAYLNEQKEVNHE